MDKSHINTNFLYFRTIHSQRAFARFWHNCQIPQSFLLFFCHHSFCHNSFTLPQSRRSVFRPHSLPSRFTIFCDFARSTWGVLDFNLDSILCHEIQVRNGTSLSHKVNYYFLRHSILYLFGFGQFFQNAERDGAGFRADSVFPIDFSSVICSLSIFFMDSSFCS